MFHVFVEGAKDGTPAGVKALAAAIAEHYGLAAADMERRFTSGRFRVKGNCDRKTAEEYARDLEQLGARVTIEAATPENSRPTPVAGYAVQRPTPTPPAGTPAVRPSQPQFASGLSAAFSGDMPAASLGALEKMDSALSLASVDGSDTGRAEPEAASFAPPDAAALPASIGPAPDKPKPEPKKAKPKDEPIDLFMPPDAEDANFKVDLAGDEVERSARKRASTPPTSLPAVAQAEPQGPPQRRSQPSMQAVNATSLAPTKSHPLADERVRFVAGVVLAILIGFLPAHLVASMREKSAYDAIDETVKQAQRDATTPDLYAKLDEQRAEALERKKGSRQSIAIMAFVIWAAVGGAAAYGWFKRVPWDRFES